MSSNRSFPPPNTTYTAATNIFGRLLLVACLSSPLWADGPRPALPAELTVEAGRPLALHIRIAVDDGLFFLQETPQARRRTRDTQYLALWNDASTGNLYLYERVIRTDVDVSDALLALNEQVGPYLDSLIQAAPEVIKPQSSLAGDASRANTTRWSLATLRALHGLLARDKNKTGGGPGATVPSDGNVSDVQIVCQPCPASVGVVAAGQPATREQALDRDRDKTALTPSSRATPVGLVDAIQAACCTGGNGGGGSCAGLNCDDGNVCTTDSCYNGGCSNVPVSEPCCDGSVADALSNMEQDLAALVASENLFTNPQLQEPSVNATGTGATSLFSVYDASQIQVRGGTVDVGCGVGGGSANLVIDVNNGDASGAGATRRWILTQAVVANSGAITLWGDITVVDVTVGSTTLVGGWTWSMGAGAQLDPASDPGFQDAVAEMMNLTTPTGGAVAGLPPALGSLLQWMMNVLRLPLNYILDLYIPYTPPTSCTGPIVEDGAGQSCENAGLLCKNDLADMCLNIADMPGSTAFKKCMKGRCGCGGSSFPRARITCDDSDSCGPCGFFGDAGGCSSFGARIWYCQQPDFDACTVCAATVFHEMSHACGTLDDPNCGRPTNCAGLPDPGSKQGACRIGLCFAEQCCLEPPAGN